LPFAKPLARGAKVVVFGVRSHFTAPNPQKVINWTDGKPILTFRKIEKGVGLYWGILPGLGYFQPAMPLRPMDRGSTHDAVTHYLPDGFNNYIGKGLRTPAILSIPVTCSEPLVETTVIEAPQGVVIPLINWKGKDGLGVPIKNLRVTVNIPV